MRVVYREDQQQRGARGASPRRPLSPTAPRGVAPPASLDALRTDYQRDRDKILHSKSFRRLSTRPRCSSPEGDHFRTRLTHTPRWRRSPAPSHGRSG